MTYRADLDALAARHAALETELAQKTLELDQASRLLDDARARARLPVLDNIRIASPCTADWQKMSGDDRARHCGDCNKSVYNLSGMTREDAEALIVEKEGRLCVRYFQRTDGTILLKDCTVGVSRRRRRHLVAASAAALLAGGGLGYMALHAGGAGAPERPTEMMQGQMVAEPALEPAEPAPEIDPDSTLIERKGDISPVEVLGELPVRRSAPPPGQVSGPRR